MTMTANNFSYANDFCDKTFPAASNRFENELDALFCALIGGGDVPYPYYLFTSSIELVAYIADEVLVLE